MTAVYIFGFIASLVGAWLVYIWWEL